MNPSPIASPVGWAGIQEQLWLINGIQKSIFENNGNLENGETVNGMTESLSVFADEVTRVAKEVGTDGKLGGQARVTNVSGTWKVRYPSLYLHRLRK